jgi:hypothetical protein
MIDINDQLVRRPRSTRAVSDLFILLVDMAILSRPLGADVGDINQVSIFHHPPPLFSCLATRSNGSRAAWAQRLVAVDVDVLLLG